MALAPSIHDATDEQLLAYHREGVDGAFDLLVKRYERELYQFLARFVGDRTAADDLFQETFIQVHLAAERFDVTRRFKPWLFAIAASKGRDLLRSNRRQAPAPLSAPIDGEDGRSFEDLLEADAEPVFSVLASRELQEQVRGLVNDMPDHLREVLLLAYFHQFAYREIAEMLSIPLGTVKSRLNAAVGTFARAWKRGPGREGSEIGHAKPPRNR